MSSHDDKDQDRDENACGSKSPAEEWREQRDAPNSEEHQKDDPPEYVGRGHPPKHGQIVKGEIRNPWGRPTGSKNRPRTTPAQELSRIILEEAERMVPVGDGTDQMPMMKLVVRATNVAAAKQNARAARIATDLVRQAELERRREIEVWYDYKTAWTRELAHRKSFGIKGAGPLPHPDHVVIDLARGCVHIKGPATKEEKVSWARWEFWRDEYERDLPKLRKQLRDPKCADPQRVAKELERTIDLLRVIGFALDGNRDAMALLEGAFAEGERVYPEYFRERRKP